MKYLPLFLAFLAIIVTGTAQPLQNLHITPANGFTVDTAGGETIELEASFTNTATHSLPVVISVTVDSSYNMTGDAFTPTAVLRSHNSFSNTTTALHCNTAPTTAETEQRYACISQGRPVLGATSGPQPSENTVRFNLTAVPAIIADTYQLSFAVHSQIGVPAERTSHPVTSNTTTTVSTDTAKATITSTTSGSASIDTYSSLAVSPPHQQTFANGVDVTVTDHNGDLARASGTITLHYTENHAPPLDESSLRIYYYNATAQTWEPLNTTQDFEANTLTATVPHFSAYAAFGDTVDTSGGGSSDADTPIDSSVSVSSPTDTSSDTTNDTTIDPEPDDISSNTTENTDTYRNNTRDSSSDGNISISANTSTSDTGPAGGIILSPTPLLLVLLLIVGGFGILWYRRRGVTLP